MEPLELLGVTLLNRCNIWCNYCYNAKNSKDSFAKKSFLHDTRGIAAHEVESLIDDALVLGLKDVQLSGGEPLLRLDDVLELITYCRERGVSIGLFTNATLAKPKIVRRLKERGLSWVRISLGGATHEAHGRERGGTRKMFERIIDHTRNFVGEGIPVGLFCPIVKTSSAAELVETAEMAGDLGVDSIVFDNYIPSGIRDQDESSLMPSAEYLIVLGELLRARRRLLQSIKLQFYYGTFEYVSPEWRETEPVYPCPNGRTRLSLDVDGNIRPSLSNARILGNIRDAEFNLAELWTNHDDLAEIRNRRPQKPCSVCRRWNLCKDMDDSHSFNLRGTAHAPPVTCPVVRGFEDLVKQKVHSDEALRRVLGHLEVETDSHDSLAVLPSPSGKSAAVEQKRVDRIGGSR